MFKAPYIIMAPPYYHASAGVRALYRLQRHLRGRGYRAEIFQLGDAPADAIVVYPETVPGNPMKGSTVARFVLNFPGLLGGDSEYDPKELIFTYHPRFYPGAPVLTVPIIEDFFRDEGLPRSGGCFWVGKGVNVPRATLTEGMREITFEWPEKREDLARLFNESEIFYSYDDNTAMITEARHCGCRVVVIPGEPPGPSYDELIKDFETQLDNFIGITQAAAPRVKIAFGCMVNDRKRLDMILRNSEIGEVPCYTIEQPDSAAKGLNKLLDVLEEKGAEIGILTHQDMYYREAWLPKLQAQLALLPENWVIAGIVGKDEKGELCGRFHDMSTPLWIVGPQKYPAAASCIDECVIIVNMKSGFRFDEALEGFDLYGTYAVLRAKELGTAWIIDAWAEHYCARFHRGWEPNETFMDMWKFLYNRFPGQKLQSTVLVD